MSWIGDEQYLYLDDEDGLGSWGSSLISSPQIEGVVLIGGNGFTEETKVRLDDNELSCQLESLNGSTASLLTRLVRSRSS